MSKMIQYLFVFVYITMVKYLIPENSFDVSMLQCVFLTVIEAIQAWETVNAWGWRKFVLLIIIGCNNQIPLEECFEKFNMPDRDNLNERICNNLTYYRTNYLALYVLFLLITAQDYIFLLRNSISSLKFAIIDACVAILWM